MASGAGYTHRLCSPVSVEVHARRAARRRDGGRGRAAAAGNRHDLHQARREPDTGGGGGRRHAPLPRRAGARACGRARRADLGEADPARARSRPRALFPQPAAPDRQGGRAANNFVWIDMESSPYVDPTLDLFRRTRVRSPLIGIAIQAYLHRTAADIEALLPLGPAIRLVKGAYLEPPDVAFPKKADVDQNYYRAGVPHAAARCAENGYAPAHRDARPGDRRPDERVHRRAAGAEVGLRIRDAVRHPARPPAAACRGPAGASAC